MGGYGEIRRRGGKKRGVEGNGGRLWGESRGRKGKGERRESFGGGEWEKRGVKGNEVEWGEGRGVDVRHDKKQENR